MPWDPEGKPLQATLAAPGSSPAYADAGELRGQLTTPAALLQFIRAGAAIITVKSRKTGHRFTYRFGRPKGEPQPGRSRPVFLSLLTGAGNESDYSFLGTCFDADLGRWQLKTGRSTRVSQDALGMKGAVWLCRHLTLSPETLFTQAEVWHEGRCGRCGRKLTVPSSIDTGFGPECAGKVGL